MNLAVNAEEQQRARIGRHIDGAGAGGGVQEIESIHPNEQQHQETAGAGAEEAVIETDAADGRQGEVGAAALENAMGAWRSPKSLCHSTYASTTVSMTGTKGRNSAGDTMLTKLAPASAARNATAAAGMRIRHGMRTTRMYRMTAPAVPQMLPSLFVPRSSGGGAPG